MLFKILSFWFLVEILSLLVGVESGNVESDEVSINICPSTSHVEDSNSDQEEEVEDATGHKRRLVRRRTRRVECKLSGRNPPRVRENINQPCAVSEASGAANTGNRDLQYLLRNLRDCRDKGEKAEAMLSYLNGCTFNAAESPHGIIRFSDEDITELTQYITNVIDERRHRR